MRGQMEVEIRHLSPITCLKVWLISPYYKKIHKKSALELRQQGRERERKWQEREKNDKNKMFIRYENLTGNFIGFFSYLDLNKQHNRINGFFAQADIEKGKRKRFSFVELFGCCFFLSSSWYGSFFMDECVKMLAIETDVMT